MISLYIHIPFCKKKCAYCSFYSQIGYKPEYTDALIRALNQYGGKTLKSVYIGGGTPSVVPPRDIQKIFDEIYKNFTVTDNAEITVEVNPESVNAEFLQTLKNCGVNRISMGVQSFCDNELSAIGRLHDAKKAKDAIALCKSHGFHNISCDLIFGLPYQTTDSLKESVNTLISLDIPHISCYNLQLEEGTPILNMAHLTADEDTQAKMYYLVCDKLKDAGYLHYEISNFCKDGFRARHNSAYWDGTDYLGLGPAAHSRIGDMRYFFDADTEKFVKKSDFSFNGGEKITDPLFEKIMLSLRTSDGLDLKYLKNSDLFIKNIIKEGFAVENHGKLILTDKGFYLSNSIIAEISAKEC